MYGTSFQISLCSRRHGQKWIRFVTTRNHDGNDFREELKVSKGEETVTETAH